MAIRIETEFYSQDGFEVAMFDVRGDAEGGSQHFGFVNTDRETDSFALVEVIEGTVTVVSEGFEEDNDLTNERTFGFKYNADQNFGSIGLSLQFSAGAVVSILVGRIRRGLSRAITKVSCKLCKTAVMAIIRAALAFAGIPLPLSGTDLSSVQTAFETALDAMRQGQVNVALQSLISLLPSSVWDTIIRAFHAVNWIFDSIDKRIEWVCVQLGLCPAATSPTSSP